MKKQTSRSLVLLLTISMLTLGTHVTAFGEVFINEIFSDPGGAGDDAKDAYIELRGTPSMALDDYYLIFIENEGNASGTGLTGQIENIFTFGDDPDTPAVEPAYTLGTNGYLTLRQNGNSYPAPPAGTTDLVNTAGTPGWGSTAGGGSSIRAKDTGNQGELEGSGFTAMLIRDLTGSTPPTLGFDLDVGNDGLDDPNGRAGWKIVDSIGYFGESGEALTGRLYAQINFGPEFDGELVDIGLPNPVPFTAANVIEPGATYVGVGYEIEFAARWGDSTGQTFADWHISNLTDNTQSGSTGVPDFRQSGGFHDPTEPDTKVETSQGIAYGTPLANTLGETNLFIEAGDNDFNGIVNGIDFLKIQSNQGIGDGLVIGAAVTALREQGDTNGDWLIDSTDIANWAANYGAGGSVTAAAAAVPEPTTALLAGLLLLGSGVVRARR